MIEGVFSTTESNTPTTLASGQQVLGKEDFLKLLVAQLSAQDPLNPMDSTEFTAQLAQFSALEQMTNVNSALQDLIKAQQAMGNSSMIGLIGKLVDVPGNAFEHTQGETTNLTYALNAESDSTKVNIFDAAGILVKTLNAPGAEGSNLVVWNGLDNQGNTVGSGIYTFKIQANTAEGKQVSATTFTSGLVTDVLFEDSAAFAVVNGEKIPAEQITRVSIN